MSLRTVLGALEAGDRVVFNASDGVQSAESPELEVIVANDWPLFEGHTWFYEVRPDQQNGIVLYRGEKGSEWQPDQFYAVVETMEFIGS